MIIRVFFILNYFIRFYSTLFHNIYTLYEIRLLATVMSEIYIYIYMYKDVDIYSCVKK